MRTRSGCARRTSFRSSCSTSTSPARRPGCWPGSASAPSSHDHRHESDRPRQARPAGDGQGGGSGEARVRHGAHREGDHGAARSRAGGCLRQRDAAQPGGERRGARTEAAHDPALGQNPPQSDREGDPHVGPGPHAGQRRRGHPHPHPGAHRGAPPRAGEGGAEVARRPPEAGGRRDQGQGSGDHGGLGDRRPARADPPERGRAPPRGHHHGRQRPVGAGAQPAAPVRAPRRDEGGARDRRRRDRSRGRSGHAVRVLRGELAAPSHRDLRADEPARGVHRQGSRGAARAGRHGARAGRAGAARARRPRRRRPRGARHARRQAAGAPSVHLLFVPRRAGARGAPARRGSPEGHEAARGHRRGGGARQALHRPLERPRSADSHLGRAAHLELPAVAARLHRVVHDAGALARRHATRSVSSDPRLPAARAAVWQGHGPHGPHGSPLMSRNLLVRIAVAVPAIAVSVAVVWLGGWVLATALAVLGVLGTREVYDLARRDGIEPFDRLGLVAAAAVPLATFWVKGYADWEPVLYVAALWLLAVLVMAMARGPARRPLTTVSVTVVGVLYASALLAFTVAIRHGPHSDAHPRGSVALVLFPLVVTWVCDTCAMAAGTLVGGPKLAPVLSPRKTWAGAVGGIVGGLVAALVYGPLVLDRVALRLGVVQLATVGVVVAVAAQVGDVAESLFKREAGVKDSSSLIPGHGGVLDRLDSLYFVLPLTAGLFRLFGVA